MQEGYLPIKKGSNSFRQESCPGISISLVVRSVLCECCLAAYSPLWNSFASTLETHSNLRAPGASSKLGPGCLPLASETCAPS